jgi:hypothetical protein
LVERHYAKSRKVEGSNPDEFNEISNLPNPSNRTMALGSTKLPIEMSTRNLPGGRGQPGLKADKISTICEKIF